ncbi:MAG: hypothetical protein SGI74_00595 [Oligoflexia bacterium]|nr:hypothetical protein [Oligoflexia bacterium]
MRNFIKTLLILSGVFLVTSCGPHESFSVKSLLNEPDADTPPSTGNEGLTSALKICSKLSFSNVKWPSSLTASDRDALMLALNLSGSFEGSAGWGNITNNFDGTGLSLGLLNQTLGTGSLQPLLIEMRNNNYTKMESVFGSKRFQSVLDMLALWEKNKILTLEDFETSNRFDIGFDTLIKAASRNSDSINWAKANLYQSNGRFIPEWSKELTALAKLPEYISIQIKATLPMHTRSLDYEKRIGVRELRAYLMMFDVTVQNGSIPSTDWADFATYLKASPKATATERLDKILELRLRHVRTEYVSDVKARKQAIINGRGIVHGTSRKLETEYCYSGSLSYR